MYEEFKKISGLSKQDDDVCISEECTDEKFSTETIRNLINRPEEVIFDIISDLKIRITALEQENKELRKLVIDMTASVDRRTSSLENLYNTAIEKINDNNLKAVVAKEEHVGQKFDKYNVEPDECGIISKNFVEDLLTYPDRYKKYCGWIFYIGEDSKIYRFREDGSDYQLVFGKPVEFLEDTCYWEKTKNGILIKFSDDDGNDREMLVKDSSVLEE